MDLGAFETVRQLAGGWLGPTYLAVEKASSLAVAVKVISPEFLGHRDALSRLADLTAALAHPPAMGIVRLLGCTRHVDGGAVLAMPFQDGTDLGELLAQKPGKPLSESLRIACELAVMLDAGHRAGLRHLALRPSQVLIAIGTEPERGIAVHLLGLGLAEALGLQKPANLPGERQVYLAPEQKESARDTLVGEATDTFALGTLLLHMWLGTLPSIELVQKCRSDGTKALGKHVLSEDTARLLQAMLAVDPRQRPSLPEVRRLLEMERRAALLMATLPPPPLEESHPADKQEVKEVAHRDASGDLKAGLIANHEGSLFGNFRIIRRLGQGGMGVVYEAEHRQIGRRAAVKVMHPEYAANADYARRFLNEARAVNIIRHPGLVEIFEYGQQTDGTLYIIMELLLGESLRARLDKKKEPYPIAQVVAWSIQIARALTATHEKGIIHRDLKPENIMLVPDPVRTEQDWIKILDFGIAKVTERTSARTSMAEGARTGSGSAMGTPIYMAPEQYRNAEVADGRADVFSFGVLLYEMLAGKLPYQGESLHLIASPAKPIETVNPAIPKALAALVARMMSILPADRPTMAEVEAVLTRVAKRYAQPHHSLLLPVAGSILAALLCLFGFLGYRFMRPLSLPEARERALSFVVQSLGSGQLEDQLQSTQALGRSRDIAYLPLLEPLLIENRPALVGAAARGIGEISAVQLQPALLALLARTEDANIRLEAAAALARLSNPKGLEVLRGLVQQGESLTQIEAALRLLEYGDRTGTQVLSKAMERQLVASGRMVPVLAALAQAGDAAARHQLTELFGRSTSSGNEDPLVDFSLARLGEVAARRRLAELASRPGPAQILAARFLCALGEATGYAVLVNAGSDDRLPERLRELAFEGLGDSGHAEAATVLAQTLAERGVSMRLRISAAGAILKLAAGESAVLASRSLSWAHAALGSDSSSTRELAVMLLGDLEAEDSVTALRQALKDHESAVRRSAAQALGHKSVRAALEALADTLDDSEEVVRSAGMQSIGQVVAGLRRRGERNFESVVLERLQQMTQQGTEIDRVVAGGTLLRMGDTGQRTTLRAGLRSTNPLVRRLACDMMEPDPQLLAEALKDGDRLVRFAAARRLGELGSKAGVAVLRSILTDGGLDGLIAYNLLQKLDEQAEPPVDLASLLEGKILREKEAVLQAVSALPPALALKLLSIAASDSSSIIRRRASEIALRFFTQTLQAEFRNLLLALRNDPDIIVRSRAVELSSPLPAAGESKNAMITADGRSPPAGLPPARTKLAEAAGAPTETANSPPPGNHAARVSVAPAPSGNETEPRSDASASAAEQFLRDTTAALRENDYSRAEELLSRVHRLGVRKLKANSRSEFYFLQGQLYESQQQFPEAMDAYLQHQRLPIEQHGPKAQQVKEAIGRLAKNLGQIQIYVLKEGRCQLASHYYLSPGEHTISLGEGNSQTVTIEAGKTIQSRQCP